MQLLTASGREAVIYGWFNRTLCKRGAVFGGMFLFGPSELHETGSIQKHWNRATIYAETKRVLKHLSEIHTLEMWTEKLQLTHVLCNMETVQIDKHIVDILVQPTHTEDQALTKSQTARV